MHKPFLAGNWKMNKTAAEAVELVMEMKEALSEIPGLETVFCPPFMAIPDVARLASGTAFHVGAQNIYWEETGGYTGESSPAMLREFCDHVIIGHSERRGYSARRTRL